MNKNTESQLILLEETLTILTARISKLKSYVLDNNDGYITQIVISFFDHTLEKSMLVQILNTSIEKLDIYNYDLGQTFSNEVWDFTYCEETDDFV